MVLKNPEIFYYKGKTVFIIPFLAILGFCLSVYSYLVETRLKKDSSYKPACDLSDKISCSKPFLSKYSKLYYFSTSIFGLGFYTALFFASLFGLTNLLILLSFVGMTTTIFLAFILYREIKSFCLICTAIYIINILIFVLLLL